MIIIDGRKIPPSKENPIDNIIIDFATKTNPYLRALGFTPNILTTLALITGLISAYLIYRSWFLLAGVFYVISYIFDCMDGNMARMFGMETKFGDWYDHLSDIGKSILILYFVFANKSLSKCFKYFFIAIFIIMHLLSLIHLGCQEKSYEKTTFDSLSAVEWLCPSHELISYTRYFGVGTCILVTVALLVLAQFI